MLFFLLGIALGLGGFTYWIGLWDRVEFKYQEFLLSDKKELFVLVAKCTEKGIGRHAMRLLDGSKKAIDAAHVNSIKMQSEAAASYGAPQGADSLSLGIYYDNPNAVPHPRWAIGWAVAAKDFEETKAMAKKANEIKTIDDEIVAVRLGGVDQHIITGRVPWRHIFTPMIAPMFFWGKAFDVYDKGGYKSTGNTDKEGAVALEVYGMGSDQKGEWIDYVVLHGDVEHVWGDAYPVEAKK
jgi:hypothetical protein